MRFAHVALALLASSAAFAQEYFPPSDAQGGWRTLKDAAEIRKTAGMDLQKLDWAFDYAARTSQHGGLVVVRHGYLVYEKYYGKGNREALPAMASVGKAYASIACGIMLNDKRAQIPDGLETKVFNEKYLPEALPLDDPRKADIKLGQLLSMAAGFHGEGSNPGFVNFEPSVKLAPVPRPAQPLDQDMSALRTPLWCAPRRRVFLRVEFAARGVDRAAAYCRDGDAAVSRRETGEADGLGTVGVRAASRRPHARAHAGWRRHGDSCDRCRTLRLSTAAQGPVGQTAARAGPSTSRTRASPRRIRSTHRSA